MVAHEFTYPEVHSGISAITLLEHKIAEKRAREEQAAAAAGQLAAQSEIQFADVA